jgi:hypothetical protein
MTTPLEKDDEAEFVAWCKGRGHVAKRLKLDGERGWPDETVLLNNGRVAFVELKRRKRGKVSYHQTKWIEKLRGLGHDAAAFDNLKDACDFIKGLE